jgi:phosphate transport system substrate-binding protein
MKTISGRILSHTPLTILTAMLALAGPARADVVLMKGSDPLAELARKLAGAYTVSHPEMKLEVTGGGTAAGLAALQEKKAAIVNASRHIKYKEAQACIKALGNRPAEYKIGINGLAVYVNRDNPIKFLTLDQLAAIYSGKSANWKQVGGNDDAIVVYGGETNSAAYEFFREEVLGGREFAANAKPLPGPDVMKAIAGDKRGIGYGAVGNLDGVRALGIKRAESSTPVAPGAETIRNQTYPIADYFYYYVNPAMDQGEIRAWLDWVRGDEGQEIVRQSGFYPLPAGARGK